MNNWNEVKLEDVCIKITDGSHWSPKSQENGYPMASVKDMGETELDLSSCRKISKTDFEELVRQDCKPKVGDVLIAKDGSYLKQIFDVKKEQDVVILSSIAIIRPNEQSVTPRFLKYVFKNPTFQEMVSNNYVSGAVIPRIVLKDFCKIPFSLPPLDVQKRIAGILGALDDRIDVLRRENVVLEQMAQAVFQSWFVDFDIVRAKAAGTPESEVCEKYHITPELYALFPSALTPDNLPLGWEKKKLGDVILCFDSKRIPLSKKQREEMKGGVPYYGATSIVDYVNKEIFDDVYLLMGEDGSVIDENGKPFLQYIWGKAWINNHAHVLQGKRMVSTETLYLFLKNFNIRPYVTGAVQAKLNQQNMNSIPFVYASESIHNIFHERISSFFSKIRCNTEQTRTLEQTRDALLPKLMNGEIEV